MALSKTAISAEWPRRRGFEVWAEWNMTGRNRAVCVRSCVAKTYVSDRAAEVVRTLTKWGYVGGTAKDAKNAKNGGNPGKGKRQGRRGVAWSARRVTMNQPGHVAAYVGGLQPYVEGGKGKRVEEAVDCGHVGLGDRT